MARYPLINPGSDDAQTTVEGGDVFKFVHGGVVVGAGASGKTAADRVLEYVDSDQLPPDLFFADGKVVSVD